MIDLNNLTMRVSSTAANGVVGSDTRLCFTQIGARVVARYSGGAVARGWLVGRWEDERLNFRYAQREEGSGIHAGRSVCEVQRLSGGRLRLIEHFTWTTRPGSGTNVFDEV